MKLFDAFRGHREQRPDKPAFMIASGDRALPISWRQFTDGIAVIAWLIDKHEVKTVALIGDYAETPRYQGAGSSLVNCTKLDTLLEVAQADEGIKLISRFANESSQGFDCRWDDVLGFEGTRKL